MNVILTIIWMYQGAVVTEHWEMPSFSDCIQSAYYLNVENENLKEVTCRRSKKGLR